jgi:hypothetical protein
VCGGLPARNAGPSVANTRGNFAAGFNNIENESIMLHNKTNFIARRRVSAAMIYYNIKPSGVLRKTHFSAPSGPFLTQQRHSSPLEQKRFWKLQDQSRINEAPAPGA